MLNNIFSKFKQKVCKMKWYQKQHVYYVFMESLFTISSNPSECFFAHTDTSPVFLGRQATI